MPKLEKRKFSLQRAAVHPYLTKRALERAISKGTRHIFQNAVATRGHAVKVSNGWVVRINSNGTEDRISQLPVMQTNNIVLD